MKYKRVLIKLSGEWLANKDENLSIDCRSIANISNQIKKILKHGTQVAIVVGGGNIWRGACAEKNGIPRSRADFIGMMATIMNALTLQSIFEENNIKTRVVSSIQIDAKIAEPFIIEKINKYLNNGEVVIMAAGTGRPYFTTDTAAALFASEIKADVLLLGKNNVNGIYNTDPKIDPDAIHYNEISYDKILEKNLKVMDASAVAMARDNNLSLLVFNIGEKDSIVNTLLEKGKFTKVIK